MQNDVNFELSILGSTLHNITFNAYHRRLVVQETSLGIELWTFDQLTLSHALRIDIQLHRIHKGGGVTTDFSMLIGCQLRAYLQVIERCVICLRSWPLILTSKGTQMVMIVLLYIWSPVLQLWLSIITQFRVRFSLAARVFVYMVERLQRNSGKYTDCLLW